MSIQSNEKTYLWDNDSPHQNPDSGNPNAPFESPDAAAKRAEAEAARLLAEEEKAAHTRKPRSSSKQDKDPDPDVPAVDDTVPAEPAFDPFVFSVDKPKK